MKRKQAVTGGAVNDAIHAYSKLISHFLFEDDRITDVHQIINFLKTDYTNAMSDPITQSSYNEKKSRILTLFGENLLLYGPESAIIASTNIFTELQILLYQTFST